MSLRVEGHVSWTERNNGESVRTRQRGMKTFCKISRAAWETPLLVGSPADSKFYDAHRARLPQSVELEAAPTNPMMAANSNAVRNLPWHTPHALACIL